MIFLQEETFNKVDEPETISPQFLLLSHLVVTWNCFKRIIRPYQYLHLIIFSFTNFHHFSLIPTGSFTENAKSNTVNQTLFNCILFFPPNFVLLCWNLFSQHFTSFQWTQSSKASCLVLHTKCHLCNFDPHFSSRILFMAHSQMRSGILPPHTIWRLWSPAV